MSTDKAGSTWGRWRRRAAALAVATTTIAAPLALLAQPTSADVGPVADAGMHLEVAQATLASTGDVTIAWNTSSATVTPGKDTLVRAQFFNNGSVPTISSTMTVNTGGRIDTAYADPSYAIGGPCSVNTSGATDVVTCNYGYTAAGGNQPYVYLAIKTATAAVTTTGSETAVSSSLVPIDYDNDDSGSVTSTPVANSGFAFLTDGQSVSFTSTDGKVAETFRLPAGATNGGGFFVQLKETSSAGQTCGGGSCYPVEAAADFLQVGGTTTPTKANPLTMSVTYLTLKQSCNGLGGPSGCAPLYSLPTGVTTGPTTQVPNCTTYAPNTGTPYASNDPCIYSLTKTTQGIVTYAIALLKDVSFPVIGTIN
jgi:hypothetical protein